MNYISINLEEGKKYFETNMFNLIPTEYSLYLGIVRIVTSNLISRKRFIRFFTWLLVGLFFPSSIIVGLNYIDT